MPNSRIDDAPGGRGHAPTHDYGLALVVCSSPVNRIVVSRIVQGAGLKVLTEAPEDAATVLETRRPATVVLDGGPDNRECERLMDNLAAQRMAAGSNMPYVILLSNANPQAGEPANDGAIDAIIAKPITPERLQPLIHRLVDRLRA